MSKLGWIIGCVALLIGMVACDRSPSNRSTEESGIGTPVKVGADVFLCDRVETLRNKRVGLVMNPTARLSNGVHVLDTLLQLKVNVVALFAPEHGFRGEKPAGEEISGGKDIATGLPVFSLYGNTKKPSSKQMEHIDVILFDMQDVGARFYTYISTLGLVLEAAADAGVEVIILDRPNPNGGNYVDGPTLQSAYKSFVGAFPIPIAHGMTMGELAMMMIGEGWLDVKQEPLVEVIHCEGYNRNSYWPEMGLSWRSPSPNLQTWEQAFAYLGTCLLEGTSLSEGRGTEEPFLLLGAPDLKIPMGLHEALRPLGFDLTPTTFTPQNIPGKAMNPKHLGKSINGVRIQRISPPELARPVLMGFLLVQWLHKENGQAIEINRYMNNLVGNESILKSLRDGTLVISIDSFDKDIKAFKQLRAPYLLYN